jgi:tetratricopeptide (TPR) repeat protein
MLFVNATPIFADEKSDKANALYADAAKHLAKGKYREAVALYDKILQDYPDNTTVLKVKGVAESNLGYHQKSLVSFYKIYQKDPKDAVALLGLGVGFGNFGEYIEAKKYFDSAYKLYPNSTVAKNYKEMADKTVKKYPYKPTEKPKKSEMDTKTFESYVRKISATVSKEKRYIEYPNPSFDVIKKFLRDYEKWNFEQQIKMGSSAFPDPTVTQKNNTYVLNYKIFVNSSQQACL